MKNLKVTNARLKSRGFLSRNNAQSAQRTDSQTKVLGFRRSSIICLSLIIASIAQPSTHVDHERYVHNLTEDYQTTLCTTTQSILTILRDKNTPHNVFRKASKKLAHLLAHEAASLLPTTAVTVETPCGISEGLRTTRDVVIVPVWRSGLALLQPFLDHFENARVGFIGLRRDEETAQAERYYANIPHIHDNEWVIILDPMLATGGSCIATIELVLERGAKEEQIMFVGVVGASEGIQRVHEHFPHITMIIAAEDKILNNKNFIVPGLGDFGDRYFGTE